jgi:diguanylate cyclase (GGDEF)-like protein
MAGSISDISEIKRIEEQLAKEATHDRLTGLPNRVLLMEHLEQAMHNAKQRPNHGFALLFLDFDRFKLINDSLGHDAGDELLRQIADRLNDHADSTHANQREVSVTNARLGGDEFVVLLENVVDVNSAQVVAERLLKALSKPYWLAEQEMSSTASIGIVMGSANYEQAEQVVRDADMAMYEAKRTGKACYVVFDEDMQRKMQRRLNLEIDLRQAIDMKSLHLEFEPIVDLQTGGVQAVEVHACWEHPDYGCIDTKEINSLAESSGVAYQLTKWSLDAACQEICQWKQMGSLSPIAFNLNLTPKQFGLTNLPQMVFAALNRYRLPGSCL